MNSYKVQVCMKKIVSLRVSIRMCMCMRHIACVGARIIVVATNERLVRQMCSSSGGDRQKWHIERTSDRISEQVND